MFSVVICTYNPNGDLLQRVLDSVLGQDFPKDDYELILVDNRSASPVCDMEAVRSRSARLVCITEQQQGLAFARIAGVRLAKAGVVVFVDDDNILEPGYLGALKQLLEKHSEVAVWGPGHIEVEYPDGAPLWIRMHCAPLFQQKSKVYTQYGCVVGWPDYYPAGSGMVVKQEVLQEYIRQFQAGTLTATGRKGQSLASAEDSQIVWLAVKAGLAAGTSPSLQLKHVIPAKRLNRKYLSALNFGIAGSYRMALCEMFPEQKASFVKQGLLQKFSLLLRTYIKSKGNPVLCYRLYSIERAWFRGLEQSEP